MKRLLVTVLAVALLLPAAVAAPLASFQVGQQTRQITQAELDFLAATQPEIKPVLDDPEQTAALVRELALQQLVPAVDPGVEASALEQTLRLLYAERVAPMRLLRGPYWPRYRPQREPIARVSHILVYIRDRDAPRSAAELEKAYQEAKARADAAVAAIRKNERPFAALAEEVSGAISKYNGGYMGYIALNHFRRLDPAFSDAIQRVKLNRVSDPIRSDQLKAWHILHVYDRREVSLGEVEELPKRLKDAQHVVAQLEGLAREHLLNALRQRWEQKSVSEAELRTAAQLRAQVVGFEPDPEALRAAHVWLWEAEAQGFFAADHYRRYADLERRRLVKRAWEREVAKGAPAPTEAEIRERYVLSQSPLPFAQARQAIAEELAPLKAHQHVRAAEDRLLEAANYRTAPAAQN